MTEQEKLDLQTMKDEIKKHKLYAFDMIHIVRGYSQEQLKAAGFRDGVDKAISQIVDNCLQTIDDLQRQYLTKYPD